MIMYKFSWLLLPALIGVLCGVLFVDNSGIKNVAWQNSWLTDLFLGNDHYVDQKGHVLEESFCCCSPDEIGNSTEGVLQLLNNITSRPYFRFFKLNLEKPCPYWAVQLLCTSKGNSCQVCSCDANEVPEALRYPHDMSDFSVIDSRVSYENLYPPNVDKWGTWRDADADSVYIDLVQNPEANTGYSGPMAARVWQAIYNENCMTDVSNGDKLDTGKKCKEDQVFRKLISGLHTSISLHVAAFFYKDEDGKSPLRSLGLLKTSEFSFYPKCDLYRRVVGNFEFKNNLYVLYQFILRALTKSKSTFLSDLNSLNSGVGGKATKEDELLHAEIRELFNSYLLCSETFNEAKFLQEKRARLLVPQMKKMMHNITTLMNCVTCEKCRVWGKVQTMGVASALKIVMHSSDEMITLSRGEKVSLFNLARQLAVSVKIVSVLADVCQDMENA